MHPPRIARRPKKPAESRPLRPYPPPAWGGPGPLPPGGWEIVLAGELSDKQGDLHDRLLEAPRNSRGTIFFDSCGGSAYIGLALASLIRLRGLQAVGVVAGECSSAALLPFAACSERYVTAHATLLFHPVRWQSEEQVRLEEAAEWARHFQLMEADHDRLLAALFGCAPEVIAPWNQKGRFVSGQELVDAGLAKLVDLFAGDVWKQIAQRRNAANHRGD
jgi:ATP-dependent protease ClpP protease subunit